MGNRDYVIWTDVLNATTSTGSHIATTTYSAQNPYIYTASTTYSVQTGTSADCTGYYVNWLGEEKHEDPKEWEHLLEEGEK